MIAESKTIPWIREEGGARQEKTIQVLIVHVQLYI